MRIPAALVPFVLAALGACSSGPPPAATTPAQTAAAPAGGRSFIAGDWAVQYIEQGNTSTGTLRIIQSVGGYSGMLQLDTASQPYYVNSVTVSQAHFLIRITTRDGDATIEGNQRTPTELEALFNGRHNQGRMILDRR